MNDLNKSLNKSQDQEFLFSLFTGKAIKLRIISIK